MIWRKLHLIVAMCCFEVLGQSYTNYRTGAPGNVDSIPNYAIVLAGGATDNDNAMKWMLDRANGGDVLVLRASGADGYNDYFYSELGIPVNSVESIVCNNASSGSDPYILQRIAEAECIFFAGGDQANYINFWLDSPVEAALNDFIHIKRGVMGGTSAGMAILGGHIFTAEEGTITSANALGNPFSLSMTLSHDDFLTHPYLLDVITDTHYDDPDRRGRHMTFMAQMSNWGVAQPLGIACNEYVAVAIDENGIAHCFGEYPDYEEYVYFLRQGCESPFGPEVIEPMNSLTWNRNEAALSVYRANARLDGSATFDLNDWLSNNGDGQWQNWWVENGIFSTTENTNAPLCSIVDVGENTRQNGSNMQWINGSVLVCNNQLTDNGIWIMDAAGRVVLKEIIYKGDQSFDLSGLATGVYIVHLKSLDSKHTTVLKIAKDQ
jgi:cyanophycinase-like exopeptidase